MYESFFGLRTAPFQVTPDPGRLLLTDSHKEALAAIIYGISARKGLVVVTGEVGVGKTTVLRHAFSQLPRDKTCVVYLLNPILTPLQLFRSLRRELASEHDLLEPLNAFDGLVVDIHRRLLQLYDAGKTVVVAIDEAQNMPVVTLESLRMLSNIETSNEKLLQIVLVGQSELDALLARSELRQLEQRIAVRARITGLDRAESRKYVDHRLSLAAGEAVEIFSRRALALLIRRAGGNPRRLNILCDNALLNAFGHDSRRVTWRIAREAVTPFAVGSLRSAFGRRLAIAGLAGALAGALSIAVLSLGLQPKTIPAPPSEALLLRGLTETPASSAQAPDAQVPEVKVPEVKVPEVMVREVKVPDVEGPAANPIAEALAATAGTPAAPLAARAPGAAAEPAAAAQPAPAQMRVRGGSKLARTLAPGDTIGRLCTEIYGRCGSAELRALIRANPTITDLSHVPAGQIVIFPQPAVSKR